jgi:hypothetical protein
MAEKMALRQPLDIRIFDPNNNRRTFPCRRAKVKFDLIKQGYYGNCRVIFPAGFDEDEDWQGGDKVEIRYNGLLFYRGKITSPEKSLEEPGSKEITAYGLMERCNSIQFQKRYIFPGGRDIAYFVSEMMADFVTSQIPDLNLEIEEVGYNAENVFFDNDTEVSKALSRFDEMAVSNTVYGFDVDFEDEDGNNPDRFFFRARDTETIRAFHIGKKFGAFLHSPDYSKIINSVHVKGAEAKYPNFLPNGNFEYIKVADAHDGNAVLNPSFETAAEEAHPGWEGAWPENWTLGGDAYRRKKYAKTGKWSINFPSAGDYISQSGIPVTASTTYKVETYYRARPTSTVAFHLEITPNAGGAMQRIPATGSFSGTANSDYQMWLEELQTPAGCSSVTYKLVNDHNGEALAVDDIALYIKGAVRQTGWKIESSEMSSVEVDYAFPIKTLPTPDFHAGHYGVMVKGTASSASGYIDLLMDAAVNEVAIDGGHTYQYCGRFYYADALYPGAGNPIAKFIIKAKKKSGKVITILGGDMAVQAGWNYFDWQTSGIFEHLGWLAESEYEKVCVGVRLKYTGAFVVDGLFFSERNTEEPLPSYYLPGKNLEFWFTTEDAFIQADPNLPEEVKDSIALYGKRDENESVDGISDLATAQQWAIGYFGVNAQVQIADRLDLVGYTELIPPDGLIRILGKNIPDQAPVKVEYEIDKNGVMTVSIDLSCDRPSFEKLFKEIEQKAEESTGSNAGGGYVSPGGSGGGSSEPGVVESLDDLSDVDLTTPPTDQQILAFDDASDQWKPANQSSGALDDLTNVDAGTPSEGDALIYDSGTEEWIAGTPAIDLGDLVDVNLGAPEDGDALIYDSATGKWIAAPGGAASSLSALTDVTLTDPADGEVLTFDVASGEWINATPAAGGGIPTIELLAGSAIIPTTAGCAALAQVETSTNKVNYLTLDFDASTIEYADFYFAMPSDWDAGTIKALFYWTTAGSSNTVRWAIKGRAFANDDAIDQAWGTAVEVDDAVLAAGDVHISAETGEMTFAGSPAAGQMVHLRVYRNASHANDTLTSDAKLLLVKLTYGLA